MIDLSIARNGLLGVEVRFSDLYAAATLGGLTGGVLVRAPKDAAVFFRRGVPVYAGGAAFERHYLGELLVRRGACAQAQLVAALEKQASMQAARPLLGALLVADAGVDPNVVREAISDQIEHRVLGLFASGEGTWQSAPGENARVRDIGLPCQAPNLLLRGILEHATDDELRAASDFFLGKAVQLQSEAPAFDYGPNEQKVIKYLEKPRKPDQLERAMESRRLVRAMLRLLWVAGKLKIVPASQGIPIPKATLLKGTQLPQVGGTSSEEPIAEVVVPPSTARAEARAATPLPMYTPPPPPTTTKPGASAAPVASGDKNFAVLVAEVRAMHAELEKKTYFELLGVKRETPPADVKKAFHALAKKYHPDAFGAVLTDEVAQLVREVAAKLNEANQVLTNEKSRAEYVALLSDDRIKGDSKKAEKIRDAEVKHQMGLVMLKKRDYQKAREYFNFSVTSDPDEPEYKASLAWSMFADPKFDRNEALTKGYALILEALKAKRPSSTTHFYAGQMLKAKDQHKEALFHFKRCAELDKKNTDAIREIRLIEMRAQKDDAAEESKNPLKKLFKR